VIAIAFLALFISFGQSSTILGTVHYAWSGLGCSFGPLVIMSLYYQKANRYGAIAGILIGGILAGTWHLLNPYVINFPVPAMVPGFFCSLLAIWLVSLATQDWLKNDHRAHGHG
jgi:sodium/proline symporter